jgi:hypothetical protein
MVAYSTLSWIAGIAVCWLVAGLIVCGVIAWGNWNKPRFKMEWLGGELWLLDYGYPVELLAVDGGVCAS